MTMLSEIVHGLAQIWYGWMGWLPGPLRVVSFVVAGCLAIRLGLRYGIPLAAGPCAALASLALLAVAWLAVAPEYAMTSATLQRRHRGLHGAFGYGEAIAGLLEIAERGARGLFRWLAKSRQLSAWMPVWVVVAVIVLMNVAAYQSRSPVPVKCR